MTVSINPSYHCNFSCNFCYLSIGQRKDIKCNTTENIKQHLDEINNLDNITTIDLYGGEISLLSDDYMNSLIDICTKYTDDISVISNGLLIKDWMLREDIQLSISYDGDVREKSDEVFNNMFMLTREFSVIGLVSNNFNVELFTKYTNILSENCISVELKPYSKSSFNKTISLNYEFKIATMYLLEHSNKHVINKTRLKNSLIGIYNAHSDKHVYITPDNKIASLEFIKGKEFFNKFENILEFSENYTESISEACKSCKYYGKCITEHYTDTDTPDDCSGHYSLMSEFEEKYFPNFLQVSYKYFCQTYEYDDIASDIGFEISTITDIKKEFEQYIHQGNTVLVYPLKSYVVSTIFAKLIERDFGVSATKVLSYDIFHNTDRFYKSYLETPEIYDEIFDNFKKFFSIIVHKQHKYSKSVEKIIDYYNKEYSGINN